MKWGWYRRLDPHAWRMLFLINAKLEIIMATQTELAVELGAIKDQLAKAAGEIVAKVASLESALASAGNSTPEVDAAVAELKVAAQALDDLNPDA
jgi:ABC-type transporter Mla subunit MlaD